MNTYNQGTLDKLETLAQGFFLSYDSENRVVISIKVTAGIITSIIKGCPFQFEINKKDSLTTLSILDNALFPFNISGKDFSKKNNQFEDFENVLIDLIKTTIVKVIVLNESNYQIINFDLEKLDYWELF